MELYAVLNGKDMAAVSLKMPESKRCFGAEEATRASRQLRSFEPLPSSKSLLGVVHCEHEQGSETTGPA